MYLHAGGALSAEGPLSDVQVQLPAALQLFQMRPRVDSKERVQSVRASLRCLSLAPDRVTFPLLAAVPRVPTYRLPVSSSKEHNYHDGAIIDQRYHCSPQR